MKKFLVLVSLVIITFPAYKALRHIGMITGHDTEAAVFKAGEYYNAVRDGHFPPRWSKRLAYGLGQPTFTFSYVLPYVITSTVMFAGLSSLAAFKLVMAVSFPLAAFFAYLWLSSRFGTWPGIAGGIIYALAPYHFANVYVRGAIGETVAATLLPLSFYYLDRLGEKPDRRRLFGAALAIAAVVLSHPFYGLIFSIVWIGYVIANKWPKQVMTAIVWGYLMCAFYIIPAYAYKNSTHLDRIEDYLLEKKGFVSLDQLVSSPWGFAAVAESDKDPMSVQVGAVALVMVLGALTVYRKHKDKTAGLFLVIFAAAVIMMLPVSLPVWKLLTPLRALQFPWRLLFVVNIAAAFSTGYFLARIKNKTLISVGLVMLTVIMSRGFWSVGRYYPESDLIDMHKTIGYPGTLTLLLEETPKWHTIKQESNPYTFFNVQSGIAGVKNIVWKTNYHKFEVEAEETAIINDKTHYWPGWEVFVDGRRVELIDPYNNLSQGTLAFEVPAGKHIIESRLTEPWINKFGNAISLFSLTAGLVIILKRNEKLA